MAELIDRTERTWHDFDAEPTVRIVEPATTPFVRSSFVPFASRSAGSRVAAIAPRPRPRGTPPPIPLQALRQINRSVPASRAVVPLRMLPAIASAEVAPVPSLVLPWPTVLPRARGRLRGPALAWLAAAFAIGVGTGLGIAAVFG